MPRLSTFVSHLGPCHSECSHISNTNLVKINFEYDSAATWMAANPRLNLNSEWVTSVLLLWSSRLIPLELLLTHAKSVFVSKYSAFPLQFLAHSLASRYRPSECNPLMTLLAISLQPCLPICNVGKEEGKYEGQLETTEKMSSSLVDGMTCVCLVLFFFGGKY